MLHPAQEDFATLQHQEPVRSGVSGGDWATAGVVVFNTKQGTASISSPPCTDSAASSGSSSTACRMDPWSLVKPAGEGGRLHCYNLVKLSLISPSKCRGKEGTSRQAPVVPTLSGPRCFPRAPVPACNSAIRFIVCHFSLLCCWELDRGSVTSLHLGSLTSL